MESTISAKLQFDVQQMDVETAFLNAPLEEEVYITIPDGVTVAQGRNCIRLNKAVLALHYPIAVVTELVDRSTK